MANVERNHRIGSAPPTSVLAAVRPPLALVVVEEWSFCIGLSRGTEEGVHHEKKNQNNTKSDWNCPCSTPITVIQPVEDMVSTLGEK
ncbi:nitric oxide reductase large subunit [Sesbania bispinosa]|nr:nitric oxide reductase large subunit [Sesbania bispinosa]